MRPRFFRLARGSEISNFRFQRRIGVVEHLFGEMYGSVSDRNPEVREFEISNLRFEIPGRSVSTLGKPLSAVIDKCGQTLKGVRWMSWHQEAMKDAAACEKLRGAGKQALIRRFLNAETRRSKPPSLLPERIGQVERTQGTETSKYLQEKKKTLIP